MQAYSPAGVDRAVEVQANDKLVIEFERAGTKILLARFVTDEGV
jgi:hypothetical protein